MKSTLLPCLLVIFGSNVLTGQSIHRWQRTNPGGGGAFSTVEAGPTGQIIAGSDLSGAYYTWDFGQHWDVYGAERGLFATHVSGLGFHPTDQDIFFIGTDAGIYKSVNGGGFLYNTLDQGYISDIELAPSNTQVGYAAYHSAYDQADGKVYKSSNQGETWIAINGFPDGYHILELHISPVNANIVYALTGRGRFVCTPAHLFRSLDGGITWNRIASDQGEIMDVSLHPTVPDTMYLTTMSVDCNAALYYTDLSGNLYRSSNGGTSWTLRKSDRTGIIWIKKDDPEVIRMIDPREPWPWISSGGTWRSTNSGLTWTQTATGDWDGGYQSSLAWAYGTSYNGFCKTLGESLADPDVLLWTNPQWVFATYDEGVNFQNLHTQPVTGDTWSSTGFDNVVMNEIAVSPQDPGTLYISFADLGIWRSLDRGVSWQSCNRSDLTGNWQGFGGNSLTILADPDRAGVVWAGLQGDLSETATLVKSTDRGSADSWVISQQGLPSSTRISGLSLDPNSPLNNRTLYVTAGGHVYKSMNDGATWSIVKSDGALHFTAVDALNSSIIYAGGRNGIFRSTNGGTSWSDLSEAGMKGTEEVDYFDFGYAGVSSICADPVVSGKVYITVFGSSGGIYTRNSSATSWTVLYTNPFMRTVRVNPLSAQMMYAGSSSAYYAGGYDVNSQGVLYSNNSGSSWQQVNEAMAWPFATTLAYDYANPQRIYVGSPGTGVQFAYVGGSHCQHTLTIDAPQISGTFQAVESVETQGPVVVLNPVQMQATQSISLNPHFEVPFNQTLTINLGLCN